MRIKIRQVSGKAHLSFCVPKNLPRLIVHVVDVVFQRARLVGRDDQIVVDVEEVGVAHVFDLGADFHRFVFGRQDFTRRFQLFLREREVIVWVL